MIRVFHRLDYTQVTESDVIIAAGIRSLRREDTESLSGRGFFELEVTNVRFYPIPITVTASGKNIRWERFPHENFGRHVILDHDERLKDAVVFEIEDVEESTEKSIGVHVSFGDPVREAVIPLHFVSSVGNKLLYRREDFEGLCSIVVPDFSSLNAELLSFLAKHPEYLHRLHWRRFEELLDAIFKNLGYRTELGPGRNDYGVDLRVYHRDDIGEMLTLVQAKRNDPNRPIGLEPVAALSAIVDQENAQRGLLVTTSRFLPVARRFADKEARRIVLADGVDIAAWCNKVVPQFKDRR